MACRLRIEYPGAIYHLKKTHTLAAGIGDDGVAWGSGRLFCFEAHMAVTSLGVRHGTDFANCGGSQLPHRTVGIGMRVEM